MVMLDPSKFTVTHSLPILSEGTEVTLPEGEQFRVTPEYLREVRDNMNRREENTGDLAVGCVGHINYAKGFDEQNQAPVVSYLKNWHVKPLNGSAILNLHADEWLKNEFLDVPAKYPRRSPDLWVKTKIIGPVAYLGATEPHQDLGLHPLSLSKQDDTVLRIPPTMADEAASNKGHAKIEELLKQLVSAVSDLTAKVESLTAGCPQGPGGAPEMSPEDAEKALNELLGGAGGGSEKEPEPEPKEKPKQMSADVERQLAELKAQNDALIVQMAKAEVTAKVQDFKAKGYLIEDEAAEIRDLLALPPELRPAQYARMERQYRKAPGAGVNGAAENANTANVVDVQSVVKHARTKNLSYEAAHKEIYGKFPGDK